MLLKFFVDAHESRVAGKCFFFQFIFQGQHRALHLVIKICLGNILSFMGNLVLKMR